MKRLLISCFALMSASFAMADENYNTRFSQALSDSLPLAEEVLVEWENKGPKDGDYYAAHSNFHLRQALMNMVAMDNYVPLYSKGQTLELKDSLGNVAGYMREAISVKDQAQLDSTMMWLSKGIEKFPQRLDIRMGFAALYRMLDDAEKLYSSMEQTINWMLANPDVQITWTSDGKIDSKEALIEDSMQDYFANCYYSTSFKDYAEKFADLGLRICPKSAIFWNDKAVLLLEKDDVKGALELMEKALSCNPNDELIKANVEHLKSQLKEK